MICVSKAAKSANTFLNSKYFCVNILSENQKSLASVFSTQREDKFDVCHWKSSEQNMPIIDESLAYFSCETRNSFDAGDHIILLGEIKEFSSVSGSPLCYFRGDYISLVHEKSLANIISQKGSTSLGVLMIDNKDQMLLIKENNSYRLPRANNPKNGSDGLISYLKRNRH